MPAKIRLARHGSKRKPFYHIVVADSRAPRDGKYVQRIGSYNPNTDPATIDLDFDKALDWVLKGALPTDTCRILLSEKGVMYKKHLLGGVKKGAFSEEEAESRFSMWMKDKEIKLEAKRKKINDAKDEVIKKQFEAEEKVNEARKAELAKRKLAERRDAEEETADAQAADDAGAKDETADQPKAEAQNEKKPEEEKSKAKPEEGKSDVKPEEGKSNE